MRINAVITVYGWIDGNIITEIPTGFRYCVRANYMKSKPTWFNITLDWWTKDYFIEKIYDFELEK